MFFAVIMDPKDYATTEMPSLFLHEGQFGHHFHLEGQQELTLPNFRKYDWITAYVEGLARYAETRGYLTLELHQSLIVLLACWLVPLKLGAVAEPLLVGAGTVLG